MVVAAIVLVIVVAVVFDYTNGFHDAANAIATSVSTRALTPRAALFMAAAMNFVGAHISTEVARTVGTGIIDPPTGSHGLVIVGAGLVGAKVNALEDEADAIHHDLLGTLLAPGGDLTPVDVLRIITLKEVVDTLEDAADAFETVANTVESIAVKEA